MYPFGLLKPPCKYFNSPVCTDGWPPRNLAHQITLGGCGCFLCLIYWSVVILWSFGGVFCSQLYIFIWSDIHSAKGIRLIYS